MKRKNLASSVKEPRGKKIKDFKKPHNDHHHHDQVKIILSDLFESNDENQKRLRMKFTLQSKGKVKWLENRNIVQKFTIPIEFAKDKEYVCRFLEKNYERRSNFLPITLKCIHKDLFSDLDVLYSLSKYQDRLFSKLNRCFYDKDLMRSLVCKFGASVLLRKPCIITKNPQLMMKCIGELKDTETILRIIGELKNPTLFSEGYFNDDKEIMTKAVCDLDVNIKYLSKDLLADGDFMYELALKLFQKNTSYIHDSNYLSENLQEDASFMLKMVKLHEHYLEHSTLKYDKEFMLQAIKENYRAIKYAYLNRNIAFLKRVMRVSAKSLRLVDDSEFPQKIHEEAERYAKKARSNKKRMINICSFNPSLLKHASDELLQDREFMKEYWEKFLADYSKDTCPIIDLSWLHDFEFMNKMKQDAEYMISIISIDCNTFQIADKNLLYDKSFVIRSLQSNKRISKFISKDLFEDREFSLDCLNITGRVFKHLPDRFKDEEYFVHLAVKQHFGNLRFASDRFKDDSDFLIGLHKEHINFEFSSDAISNRLQNDENFILDLLEIYQSEQLGFFINDTGLDTNKEFVIKAMKRNNRIEYFSSITHSKRVAREAVKLGYDLDLFDDHLVNDRELQLMAAKYSGFHRKFSQELFDLRMEFAYHGCKI